MTDTLRIALITGANRGLGRATALHLGRAGVGVVAAYRSKPEQAEEVVAEVVDTGGRAVAVQLDTTDFGAFAAFAPMLREAVRETFGREQIDALVNNAGTGVYASFALTSETQLDEPWAASVNPRTSPARSPRCLQARATGSPVSAPRPPAACASDARRALGR